MQVYSDPERENETWSLPDVEVFYADNDDVRFWNDEYREWEESTDSPYTTGYYYWHCFPGCMPDSDPIGPFATEAEAIDDAQEN